LKNVTIYIIENIILKWQFIVLLILTFTLPTINKIIINAEKGLVSITKFDSTKLKDGEYRYNMYTNTTVKGEKIHRAILDAIYQNFVNARIDSEKHNDD
jgi:hypothetical protein